MTYQTGLLTYQTAAKKLGRTVDHARAIAQVCDLLDAAAALARVPLLALVAVRVSSGAINPKAWVKDTPPGVRESIIRRSLDHTFTDDDYAAIEKSLNELKDYGNRAAWVEVKRRIPSDQLYQQLSMPPSDQSPDADIELRSEAMKVVTTVDQILTNISELERARGASSKELQSAYRQLIKRGTCFLSYKSDAGIAFAPSRFVGYVNNKMASHAANLNKDGRITNAALRRVLGAPPIPDVALEQLYVAFCGQLGFAPSKTGSFGVGRKYWASSDVIEVLDQNEIDAITGNAALTATEKQQLIKARVGQGLFRDRLLSYWKACCITACRVHSVLRASHIKPWSKSTNAERLDKFNGLLLSPNADVLFDKGLITFSDDGSMLASPRIAQKDLVLLLGTSTVKITTVPNHAPYLQYHRKHRFRATAA